MSFNATSEPRFDGLYRCKEGGYLGWLRFFSDGLVLNASTTEATPEQIARWLRPSHAHLSSGQWRFVGDQIAFSVTSRNGSVDFEGYVNGDTLVLGLVSRINGYRSQGEWSFHPLDAHTLDGPTEAAP